MRWALESTHATNLTGTGQARFRGCLQPSRARKVKYEPASISGFFQK
jgi:hypothetical protein